MIFTHSMPITRYIFSKNFIFSFIYLVLAYEVVCYPADKLKDMSGHELKDEIRYPNGTVIGKYTYTDNEGNPIHVTYFADDASYGVELKSVKVIDSVSTNQTTSSSEEQNWPSNYDTLKPIDPLGTSELFKQKIDKTKEKVNVDKSKGSDYETFYQTEIKSPRECGKGKVRVYLDKEKRIIKRALDNYQAAKYCKRF